MATAIPRKVSIKRLKNPDDEDQAINWRVVDELTIITGSGPTYEKRTISFNNRKRDDEDENPSGREFHAYTVTHHALNEGGTPNEDDEDDADQKLEVERLDSYTIKSGSGPTFQRLSHRLNTPEDEDATRVTHRKRVYANDDPDDPDPEDDEGTWLDDERVDQITLVSGSGPTFKRETIFLEWKDKEGDDEEGDSFDKMDGPLIEDEGPPYRSSPFQNIVNVQWRKVYIIFAVSTPNHPPVPTDEKRTKILAVESFTFPDTGVPVTATLLETTVNIGDDFLTFTGTYAANDFGSQGWIAWVLPHKKSLIENWFQDYIRTPGFSYDLSKPFLWVLTMGITNLQTIKFSLKARQHLQNPAKGAKDKIVEMWVNSGTPSVPFNGFVNFGWSIAWYRTDAKGTGTVYELPPEWRAMPIDNSGGMGMAFGQKPPLIAADIPNT